MTGGSLLWPAESILKLKAFMLTDVEQNSTVGRGDGLKSAVYEEGFRAVIMQR